MFLISKIENKNFFLLLFFLLLKATVLIAIVQTGYINLSPDEAQYWTWSKNLDVGYFSKPPAIAWQIFTTTFFFGDTELGIRIGAIFIGFVLSLMAYSIARALNFSHSVAFWSAIATAFSPLGFYLSFAATTDAGAILFLILGIWAVIKKESPDYVTAGIFIFLGALYKWTAFVLWPFALVFACIYPQFRKKTLVLGFLISLCAFLPVVYWNMSHEWATFRHVGKATLQTHAGNFFDFLFAQIGLLSLIYFALLVASFFFVFRKSEPRILFCAAFPLAILIYLVLAWFKKIQPNWAAFLYLPGMVLLAWFAVHKKWKIWLHAGTWVSILMISAAFAAPLIQTKTALPLPYSANPFRHEIGWKKLPKILEEAGYDPQKEFLCGDKYQTSSLLSFYSEGKKRAYFFNISDTRKNQFSYWPQMEEKEKGKTGYFVILENTNQNAIEWYRTHYLMKLEPFFKDVEFLGAYPLFYAEKEPVKFAFLFKGIEYSGMSPSAKINF